MVSQPSRTVMPQARVALVALSTALLLSCSRSTGTTASATTTVSPSATVAGSYVREGHPNDVLVVEEDGLFCEIQEGYQVAGTYEAEGSEITLHPKPASLGDEVGTIDGDVITDPEGERWIRSTTAPACDQAITPAVSGESLAGVETLVGTISQADWLTRYHAVAGALAALPDTISGHPSTGVRASKQTTSVTFPDPTYAGPVSGVSIVVVTYPLNVTAARIVDVTAHLGFALSAETGPVEETADVPVIVGRIAQVEGAGVLPQHHDGYLATWATATGNVVYAVVADSPRSLREGIDALLAVAA